MGIFRHLASTATCMSLLIATGTATIAGADTTSDAAASRPAEPAISPYLLCDGRPGHVSAAGTFGQLLLITATAGIGGAALAKADVNKRLSGRDGVAACDTAIKNEGNEQRRAELALARTIHFVEAKDYPGAITSAREVPALAPGLANDIGFRHGSLAAAQFLEAYALARLGRADEAEAVAVRMASALPYDLLANSRALLFLRLTPDMDAGKAAVFAQAVKLDPETLAARAQARDWVGDYAGAADDIAALRAIIHSFYPDAHPVSLEALEATDRIMAGQVDQAHTLAAQVHDEADTLVAAGQAETLRTSIEQADELLAFNAVVDALENGQPTQARTLFGSHSHWIAVPGPIVLAMAARLRQNAAPAELSGMLAEDPAAARAKALQALSTGLATHEDSAGGLYRFIWDARASDFSALGPSVWRVGEHPAFLLKNAAPNFDTISVNKPGMLAGTAAGEALLLHAALITQSRGQTGFAVAPNRKTLQVAGIMAAGPTGATLPADATFNAATVIAALGPEFPKGAS